MLSEDGHHLQHGLIRVRVVAADELHAALHQARDEVDVTRQAVQFRDHERGFLSPALLQGGLQLRVVGVLLPAFDFGEFGQQLASRSEVTGDGGALHVHPQAARPLAVGRNPVISDVGSS